MKKLLLTILVFFSFISLFSQTTLNSAGADFSSHSGSLSYSIGEVFYEPFGFAINATPGIQQTYDISIENNLNEYFKNDFEVQLYPNPTTDYLELFFSDNTFKDKLQVLIYDMAGKYLDSFPIESEITTIYTAEYPTGIYFFHVKSNDKTVTIFKVVKQ